MIFINPGTVRLQNRIDILFPWIDMGYGPGLRVRIAEKEEEQNSNPITGPMIMNKKTMKQLYLVLLLSLFCPSLLQAEGRMIERVYIHTDKDCYVAGEDIWVKLYVVDSRFQPSLFSKTGYVEICDAQRPQMQLKLALEDGSGSGKMEIPSHLPSGIYELSAYTRYMRNEGEGVFFKRQIAIINAGQQSPSDRMMLIDPEEKQWEAKPEETNVQIKTDADEYFGRSLVLLSIDDLPENTMDLVVSVSREDSLAFLPETDKRGWIRQMTTKPEAIHSSQWIPELEGHIITARLTPMPREDLFMPNIAFVGKDIRYINGQVNREDGATSFYTTDVYGPQEVVVSVAPIEGRESVPYQMTILSPFSESLPDSLPALQVRLKNKSLEERYIGTQLKEVFEADTFPDPNFQKNYYHLGTPISYDLDNYNRFNTLGETIFEFVDRLRVHSIDGKRRIRVFLDETESFNINNALVLLDGVPVYEHEDLLKYNPRHLKTINLYSNSRYVFGGDVFDGIISFITYTGNLPIFQLREESRLFVYDCPLLPSALMTPDYSDDKVKNSRKPDFRHTLYWNPFIKPLQERSTQLSFYTSDLTGVFKVTVEGLTKEGKMVYGTYHFSVREQ